MAYEPRRNPFNPLVVGAIAVILALAAFLFFREGETTQQAGVGSPPAATNPDAGPPRNPSGSPNAAPTTPANPGGTKL